MLGPWIGEARQSPRGEAAAHAHDGIGRHTGDAGDLLAVKTIEIKQDAPRADSEVWRGHFVVSNVALQLGLVGLDVLAQPLALSLRGIPAERCGIGGGGGI